VLQKLAFIFTLCTISYCTSYHTKPINRGTLYQKRTDRSCHLPIRIPPNIHLQRARDRVPVSSSATKSTDWIRRINNWRRIQPNPRRRIQPVEVVAKVILSDNSTGGWIRRRLFFIRIQPFEFVADCTRPAKRAHAPPNSRRIFRSRIRIVLIARTHTMCAFFNANTRVVCIFLVTYVRV